MPLAVLNVAGERQQCSFPAPKRADIRGWWNAVRKARPKWPLGLYRDEQYRAEIMTDSIIITRANGSPWVLVIDRKAGDGMS